jgi:oligoendopeptidase F
VAVAGASAFATPEIMAIDDETLDRFYRECPALETWRRSLYRIRRRKAHILSDKEEKLLAAAGEMADGPDAIGSALRNADLRFDDAVDADGGRHPLSAGTFGPLMESEDRALRKSAFENCYRGYGDFRNTVAATLDAQFKTLRFFAEARRYPTTLAAALDRTEVPESVYHNLIEAVHRNLDKMYRYVALRKRLLGVDELHMYDVYRPIIEGSDKKILFDEAKANVLDAMKILGDDYVALLNRAFGERWIDRYENEGKRSGAYSSGGARPHPYILLNHHDNLDSQFTLAHELGHSMHSWYSKENQPVSTADYVIFVAEVASTCNEVLLMNYLLNKTADKKERAALINHFLDQFKGTIYRQTMFAEFELMMGQMAEKGETLTADALCEKYKALNALYFGPDMVTDDKIALEWARIPHFFYNYYVFQYATGFSAAVAIAKRILKEGAPAVADYKRFLSGGSSQDPVSLLKIAGVDMSSPAPVNEALAYFGELLDEIEKLI